MDSFEALAELFYEELRWPQKTWDRFPGVSKSYDLAPEDIPGVQSLAAVQKLSPDQEWGIFLVDFESGKLRRSDLRRILNKVAEKARQNHANPVWPHDNVLFICRSENTTWTLGHYTGDRAANAQLRTFGWSDPLRARTVLTRNLYPHLVWTNQANWSDAWNEKALDEKFFDEYKAVFEQVEASVEGLDAPEQRRRFTQSLFNRLMFLAFLQEKRWLEFEGERQNYLFHLFERFQPKDNEKCFYDRLHKLFFSGLNSPNGQGGGRKDLEPFIGKVPFLNGGLFEPDENLDSVSVTLPDKAIARILGAHGLFQQWNFTVTESTPLDIDVAVDPEMLGKIFERLVTGRHESGSYYTPRPVVSFMCREGLKGYLGGEEKLVDEHDPEGIGIPEARALIARLEAVKVCDPACGSGAYLVGMLHEIFELQRILDTRADQLTSRDDYQRKLTIIANCLFGVDIDPFAVNIAWLRLWLALVIDDSRNPIDDNEDVALPNLDAKIETGDSLIGPDPAVGKPTDLYRDSQIRDFEKLKARYLRSHGDEKRELFGQLQSLRVEIAEWAHPNEQPKGFDWRVDFAEVFQESPEVVTMAGALNLGVAAGKHCQGELAAVPEVGGFDIVLANPPYVRQELLGHIKPALRVAFGDFFCGTADLYIYFYRRALDMLRPGGCLVFISSNKWFRAAYGAKLRDWFGKNSHVRLIVDFGELPVFDAATFPMILVAEKKNLHPSPPPQVEEGIEGPMFAQVKSLAPPYPDVKALVDTIGQRLPAEAISGKEWRLVDRETAERMRRMEAAGVPLGEYVQGKIYRGVLTGCNEAFVIDGATRARLIAEDPKSAEIVKPLAVGDDVRRWHIRERDRWLIVTKIGVDMDRYPAIFRHLQQWQERLEIRQDQGNHWWELRPCAYYDEFDKPKIVYPQIMMEPRYTLDANRMFTNQKCFIIGLEDYYLLGLLNSKSVWGFLVSKSVSFGDPAERGRLEPRKEDVMSIPIPRATDADRAAIATLVRLCLDAKSADPSADVSEHESEIDKLVEKLYFG